MQCKTGTEYPGQQDCVTISQTSERVGDLALVEVSRRAAPLLLPSAPAAVCFGPVEKTSAQRTRSARMTDNDEGGGDDDGFPERN